MSAAWCGIARSSHFRTVQDANGIVPSGSATVVKRGELCVRQSASVCGLIKRRAAERGFAWLEKHRCLWKNHTRKLHNSLQMPVLVVISLLPRRF
jgi:hypothetical protein